MYGAGRHEQQPEHPVLEEAVEPARRVQEVEGVPRRRRVHHDEVEAALLVQLVQLLHRHVLLGPRQRRGQVAVEAILEDPVGLLGVSEYRATRSSKVPFASSITADSSPLQSPSIRRGVLSRCSRPSASASRRAGSIVTTQVFRPCLGACDADRGRDRRLAGSA